jgi:hypothetical protein
MLTVLLANAQEQDDLSDVDFESDDEMDEDDEGKPPAKKLKA